MPGRRLAANILGHPDTAVAPPHHDVSVAPLGRDGELTSVGHCLQRVARQIPEDLAQEVFFTAHFEILWGSEDDSMAFEVHLRPPEQINAVAEHVSNVAWTKGGPVRAGVLEEAIQNPGKPPGFIDQYVEQALALVIDRSG